MTVSESTRTIMFALCMLGLWAPFPVWFIGALVFVIQMNAAPPSSSKRATVGLLVAVSIMFLLFIVLIVVFAFSNVGIVVILSLMLPLILLLMVAFIVVADFAFRGAHQGSPNDARDLRGVHLGLNLAGMFVFPIFSLIGIPLVIAKTRKFRAAVSRSTYGIMVGSGVLTLVLIVIVVLLASIASAVPSRYWIDYDRGFNQYPCRKRMALQETTTPMLTTTTTATTAATTAFTTAATTAFTTMSLFNTVADTTTTPTLVPDSMPTSYTDDFTASGTWAASPTTADAWFFTTTAVELWTTFTGWDTATVIREPCYQALVAYPYFRSQLQDPAVIISVVVLSLIAWATHLTFIVIADHIILKQIEPSRSPLPVGVVASQTPGAVTMVHPCASCGAQLQFNRTGAITQVQCYKCSAIVEFTTA